MYTLEDYLNFRGDLSFEQAPVNEIDELVFASLGKINYSNELKNGVSRKFVDVFNDYFNSIDKNEKEKLGLIESPITIETLNHIARCKRYENIVISDFLNIVCFEKNEQLSALTILGPDGKIYVTFRGTDDTIIAWKENGELAIKAEVPAQKDALLYLENIASKYSGPIVILGHSKGGNMAVYCSVKCSKEIQDRIEKVISYDGPGFLEDFYNNPAYQNVKNKISTIVPNYSIVGMFMYSAGHLDVIHCEKKGALSHDIFLWNVEADHFVRSENLSDQSLVFHQAINDTLDKMDMQERQKFVDEVFNLLTANGAVYLTDLTESGIKTAFRMGDKLKDSKEIKIFIQRLSSRSLKNAFDLKREDIHKFVKEKIDDLT